MCPTTTSLCFILNGVILHKRFILHLVSLAFPANLVFHQTVERIHVGKKFGDIPRGIFIVRGENVVLLGEIVSGGVGACLIYLCAALLHIGVEQL